jgi:aminopeptidase N
VAALIAAVRNDAFWGVRQEAVKTLAKASGDEVRAALLHTLKSDAKAAVRREALVSLQKFPHDDTRAAARQTIESDRSYYVVAEALRTLVKIDRDKSASVLLAALDRPSDNEVILRAACNGLVDLKDQTADEKIAKLLEGKLTPQHRGTLIAALARLKPDDPAALERLHAQLDNDRTDVRRAAIEALSGIGTTASIDKLLARREREEIPSTRARLDDAVEKLRQRLGQPDSLRTELEQLRKQNQQLEERLKKLEKQ